MISKEIRKPGSLVPSGSLSFALARSLMDPLIHSGELRDTRQAPRPRCAGTHLWSQPHLTLFRGRKNDHGSLETGDGLRMRNAVRGMRGPPGAVLITA